MPITVNPQNTQFITLFKNTKCGSKISKYSQTEGQNDSKSYKNEFIVLSSL